MGLWLVRCFRCEGRWDPANHRRMVVTEGLGLARGIPPNLDGLPIEAVIGMTLATCRLAGDPALVEEQVRERCWTRRADWTLLDFWVLPSA